MGVRMTSDRDGFETAAGLARCSIQRLGTSAELVGEMRFSQDGGSALVLVVEKYFYRVGSYASLTIMVSGDERASRVEAIASGAGDGLLNLGWGAKGRFEQDFADSMRELGYA